jgi:hypothetical protein
MLCEAGYAKTDIDAKISAAFQQLFFGKSGG